LPASAGAGFSLPGAAVTVATLVLELGIFERLEGDGDGAGGVEVVRGVAAGVGGQEEEAARGGRGRRFEATA
jgi:hypothetical protein